MDINIGKLNVKESTSFFHLYKNNDKVNQHIENRRNYVAQKQADNRRKIVDINRCLDAVCENDAESKQSDNCFYRKSINDGRVNNLMMLAEWMMILPKNFHENFLMKICPVGKHVIVASQKGSTQIRNKVGRRLLRCKSIMPGGGLEQSAESAARSAILDCIYNEESGTVYILDLLCFMRQDFREMTAEDRFNWLLNFIHSDFIGIERQSDCGIKFELVRAIDCNKDVLEQFFSTPPTLKPDGLLFYEKDGIYEGGSSFAVSWLKPYMVPELLLMQRPLDPGFLENMPMDYADYRGFIVDYNRQYSWKVTRPSTVASDNKKSSKKKKSVVSSPGDDMES